MGIESTAISRTNLRNFALMPMAGDKVAIDPWPWDLKTLLFTTTAYFFLR
jgi:hypothetical protein